MHSSSEQGIVVQMMVVQMMVACCCKGRETVRGAPRMRTHEQPLVHVVLGCYARRCAVLDLLAQDVPHRDVNQVVLHTMEMDGSGSPEG